MKNTILYIILIVSSILMSKSKIAFIAKVEGYVEILSKDNTLRALEAVDGRYIYEGDIIRSFKDSNCTVMFEDQSAVFAIDSYSEVELKKTEKDIKKINFNYGELYIENSSKNIPLFVFTRSSQVLSIESSGFLKSFTNGEDHVYCINNKIELYNKKSKLEVAIYENNKVLSLLDGKVELKKNEESFLPYKLSEIIKVVQKNLREPAQEFNYEKGDLLPNYSVNTYLETYDPIPKKNYMFFIGSGISYLNGNPYGKITINSLYNNKQLNFNIEIDHYFSIDSSPEIDTWGSVDKILSKIKYLNYKTLSEDVVFESGGLKDITFGHGLLLKRYSNRYNYPLKNTYGINLKLNKEDFIDFEMFISNIDHLSNNGGLIGVQSSIFISKYLPLKVGFGLVSDLNQFIDIKKDYNVSIESRSINALQFDLSYKALSRKGFDIDIISEVAAIIFPEDHYYKRYDSGSDDDLASGLKDKKGTWGFLIGLEGSYQDFANFKTHFHYNDPLFTPAFFNNTYEFERNRILSNYSNNIPQIEDMFNGLEVLDASGASGLIVPKDLYLAYLNDEMVFPSIGFTFEGAYNYYNKIITNFSISHFFEYDSNSETDAYSSFYLDLLIKDKIIKNIADLTFYINKNFSHNIFDFLSSSNENTIVGASFHAKLKNNFNLIFYFERVNYDYNFNLEAESIDNLEIEAIYSF